jgi:hypothetical protein
MRAAGGLLALLMSISAAASADEPVPVPVPQTLEQAAAQRERADALREQAEERYQAEQNAATRSS